MVARRAGPQWIHGGWVNKRSAEVWGFGSQEAGQMRRQDQRANGNRAQAAWESKDWK